VTLLRRNVRRRHNKIREACSRNGSATVILFCDEAQRYDENEYEWLSDVHDSPDRIFIQLFI
jgi:thymidine kinase